MLSLIRPAQAVVKGLMYTIQFLTWYVHIFLRLSWLILGGTSQFNCKPISCWMKSSWIFLVLIGTLPTFIDSSFLSPLPDIACFYWTFGNESTFLAESNGVLYTVTRHQYSSRPSLKSSWNTPFAKSSKFFQHVHMILLMSAKLKAPWVLQWTWCIWYWQESSYVFTTSGRNIRGTFGGRSLSPGAASMFDTLFITISSCVFMKNLNLKDAWIVLLLLIVRWLNCHP